MQQRCVWFAIILSIGTTFSSDEVRICLEGLGCVQGTYMAGYEAERFEAFMGIPFAEPPVGDLRLANPVAKGAWSETLLATKPRSHCMQKNYLLPGWPISGEEDCLYLNLYRPIQQSTGKLPVLFYIHGGGYFSGSADPEIMGPEYFMDTGEVILVVVAYRLGPFGFLSSGDEDMPGNFGLKDQNMALRWVQKNIAAFGGDPERVTIFGHSAGASSVHFHMLSAASKGLFQQAVLMSGTAIAPFVRVVSDPKAQALQIAAAASVPDASTLTSAGLASALRSMNATDLLNAGDALKVWHIHPFMNFLPCVENEAWSNAFLVVDPLTTMANAPPTPVPWIIGVVSDVGEGAFLWLNILSQGQLYKEFNEDFDNLLLKIFHLPISSDSDKGKTILKRAMEEYTQGVHELNNQTLHGFNELIGDVFFYYPLYKTIEGYLRTGDANQCPIGVLKFNYRGTNSFSTVFSGGSLEDYGAVHLDDVLYLFRVPAIFPQDYEKTSPEAALVKRYVGLYVDFAKNGNVKIFEETGTCNKQKFPTTDEMEFYNYLEIAKTDGNSFSDIITNKFNVKRMRLLDQLWESMK